MNDEGYIALANAIIIQAVKDYTNQFVFKLVGINLP